MTTKIAVIRVRGTSRAKNAIDDTLHMLRLYRKHYLVIVPQNDSMMGMIKKVKDYVTWGEITPETEKTVQEKRGEKDPENPKALKPFFRLQPPRKGWERGGIKTPYGLGGALGYRGEKINELLSRMI